MSLSGDAIEELNNMFLQIKEMFDKAILALETNSRDNAKLVLGIENKINDMTVMLRQNHIRRLNEGKCNVLSGIVFLDTVSNFEKIGDHLTNIGQAVMGNLQWGTYKERDEDLIGSRTP